jgi:hypothetical protein
MPLDVLDRQTRRGLPKISGLKEAYGFKVNERSVDPLFALHERTGLLYSAKPARFQPHSEMIRGNSRRPAPLPSRVSICTFSPIDRERLALVFENYRTRPSTIAPASDMDSWNTEGRKDDYANTRRIWQ